MSDIVALEAEVDAAFAIEIASSEALRRCVAQFGREATFMVWRLGWCSGQQEGLAKAQRIFND
jgi:hypothetical protein